MTGTHLYNVRVEWTGNRGSGTVGYRSYDRSHLIHVAGKPSLEGSSDPAFLGNPSQYNPEDMFMASLSACHMLWYLHLCSEAGVKVLSYEDAAVGEMKIEKDGGGAFQKVILNPKVVVAENEMVREARTLHTEANRLCFIANSCNFPVLHAAEVVVHSQG